MRKILTKIFWSHGTTPGYLGSLNPRTLDRMFSNLVFLVLWGAFEAPVKVAICFAPKGLKHFPPDVPCIWIFTASYSSYLLKTFNLNNIETWMIRPRSICWKLFPQHCSTSKGSVGELGTIPFVFGCTHPAFVPSFIYTVLFSGRKFSPLHISEKI